MGTMTIGAKYKTTVRDPGTTGILRMSEDKLTFTPNDPRSLMKLNVDFRTIKGHKFNKVDGSKPTPPLLNLSKDSDKGGGYMFEFDNVGNRDSCRDFVGLLVRTPLVPPQRARSSPPVHRAPSTKEAVLAPLAPLFVAAQRPLLSPPPTRPSCRRKTLAGVSITRTAGKEPSYKIKRASNRLKGRRKAAPIAGAAETAVCRGLGIIQDGEVVTELAMQVFADKFKGEVSDNVLAAMRQLFRVGTPEDDAIDDALLGHGGVAGLDLEVEAGGMETADD